MATSLKPVTLGKKTLSVPIIQGGMGIGVSLHMLVSAVMREDAMGVISAAQPGYRQPDFYTNSLNANIRSLHEEIALCRAQSNGKGMIGINVMVAGRQHKEIWEFLNTQPIDAIISGAGLPLDLPQIVTNPEILLAPIVSSGKAARLIMTVWEKRANRLPDFIVIEGPLAGGHLGISKAEIDAGHLPLLKDILIDVIAVVRPVEERIGRKIPLFCAGGVYTHQDILDLIELGSDGVQMATRFIATQECDAHPAFKQCLLDAKEEDIVYTISPVGLPGRGVNTPFVKALDGSLRKVDVCIACLTPCNPAATPYCITEALITAVKGDPDNGLVFTGSNGYRLDKITTVHELMSELKGES
jgi:NAD(P)H-dependent flavin oxidoreductase YrpB (nitropropane dioxygenase family)